MIGPFKKLYPEFEFYMESQRPNARQLSSFLGSHFSLDDKKLDRCKYELDVIMSNSKEYSILQGELLSSFDKHNHFIQRFTFEDSIY